MEELVEQQKLVDEQSTNIYRVPIPLGHPIIGKPQGVLVAEMDHLDGEDRHNEEH